MRKVTFYRGPVWCLAILLFVHITRAATNFVSGTISNDTTWSGTNWLSGTVVVTNGVTVSIAPGTQMLMNTSATLVVYGRLLADGTSNAPISFTRATTSATWSRIRFVRATNSLFRYCVFEFANSAGSHQDYYDDDCNTNTPPLPRTYHEAVVALATRLDFEFCTFRNLPSTAANAEGDAIAIIADDPQFPGAASARIASCQFPSIGQAIHTRFSFVLVENCLFSGKRGDNDDVDLYGESFPPPLIRSNIFLSGHEDKINPTRCSAIIVNNIVVGSDDHGIVLRDKGYPIVMNNFIYNCTSAGISVQNQCDALIANNTIVNCQRGVRFFDHFDRHGPPYCLFPGSGRAQIVNCLIWDCATPFELQASTNGQSFASVAYCNVEGGQAASSVAAGTTLLWGPGNINIDPQFVNLASNNYRLLATSPCIDAGTNVGLWATNFVVSVTNDFDGTPRPLDGNGDGNARIDIGAFEFLLATADSNGDGIPDGWTRSFGFNPTDPGVGGSNPDNDPHTTFQEWVADTNPTNALSYFRIASVPAAPASVSFLSSSNRLYTLLVSTNLTISNSFNSFNAVAGQTNVPGNGGTRMLTDTNGAVAKFYQVQVKTP
jgi:parallel beta-helix repeat protein